MTVTASLVGANWTELDLPARATWAVDGVQPRWLVRPTTPEEVASTLAQAAERGLAIAPRGGATQMGLGNLPARLDLVLHTTALDGVVEYEPADLTVTVQAGMRFTALQALLSQHGQLLPLDPPVSSDATIGGIVASNASGPLRYAFGTARDLVLGTRVANTDGTLTHAGGRVVKNVAGYDLNKLHVGGLGSLGILVELGFKLAPIPPQLSLVAARVPGAEAAAALLAQVIHSPLSPLAVELLAPRAAHRVGLPGAYVVILRVGGHPPTVARQVRDLHQLIASHAAEALDVDENVWSRLQALSSDSSSTVVVKAAAPIAASARLVDLLDQQLALYAPVVWAHAGNGVAHAAFNASDDLPLLQRTLLEARSAVAQIGSSASLVVERCPPEAKTGLDVWGNPVGGISVMRALKDQLDSRHVLNPGRFVGGI